MKSDDFFLLLQRSYEGNVYYELMALGCDCTDLHRDYESLVDFYGKSRVLLLSETEFDEFRLTHDVDTDSEY